MSVIFFLRWDKNILELDSCFLRAWSTLFFTGLHFLLSLHWQAFLGIGNRCYVVKGVFLYNVEIVFRASILLSWVFRGAFHGID